MKSMRDLWFSEPNTTQGPPPLPVIYVRDEAHIIYKRIERDLTKEDPPTEEDLNALGAEGWQIAGMLTVDSRLLVYLQKLAD